MNNPVPRKMIGERKFEGKTHYYAGRTLMPSKARSVALELRGRGIRSKITTRRDLGSLIWTDKPVYLDLMEPIVSSRGYYNPNRKPYKKGDYVGSDVCSNCGKYSKFYAVDNEKNGVVRIKCDECGDEFNYSALGWNPRGRPRTDKERAAAHFGIPVSKVTPSMIKSLPPRGSRLVNVAGVKMLKCPGCGNPTPVGKNSVYTRCNICGAPLRHVIVRKKRKN